MRILREDSATRASWDLVALLLAVTSVLVVPYQVAFEHRVTLSGSALIYLIDLFFLIDIVLNFRTSYRYRAVEVTDPREVARHYRRGLFAVDLLASVPLDLALMLGWGEVTVQGVSLVLLVRLLRLLRVLRLAVIVRRWERQTMVNPGFLRIGKLVLTVVVVLHLLACLWFLVPYSDDFPEESWVVRERVTDAGAQTQYIRALYWVVVTATSVGYGDITPHRNVEYVLSMVVILVGASMWAFIIGNIASLLSGLDATRASFRSRVELVVQFLRNRRVPPEVHENVRGYYEYIWSRYRGANEQTLLEDLPDPLRREVIFHLAGELLERVPLFRHCGPVLRDELLLALEPMIVTPGAYVVREGELPQGIYFISHGTVEVLSRGGTRSHGTLEHGEYFGDLSLLLEERRTASARALTYCDVLVLPRPEFERIKRDYEEFREALHALSSERSARVRALLLEGAVL